MQVNKLKLSKEETQVISEQQFFLLKHSATKKIVELFGELEVELKNNFNDFNLDIADLNTSTGKIFRGENYKLFPYILLDYPRLFSKTSVCAFRTMFWWGNEFSFTLHLQGEALEKCRNILYENFDQLYNMDVYFCVNENPWQYDFDRENYKSVDESIDIKNDVLTKPFIKLSRRLPIEESMNVPAYCLQTFILFFGMLK